MSSTHDWTIDTIVHALPSAELRQRCLREVHLAPLDQLEEVLTRWQALALQWSTVDAPNVDAARAYLEEHGDLPPAYRADATSQDAHQEWRTRLRATREQRGAA
ncbi:hypothetical protein [Streptomyces sp. NBC_01465]|uniref:hypothetical protein n=1 Tax=Streptomyces sp. NBC_01465 TaxID=2903878 RepID=UPI002E33AC0B|nr:hypothetical protein [Streptomyces sp. NBC_01465]